MRFQAARGDTPASTARATFSLASRLQCISASEMRTSANLGGAAACGVSTAACVLRPPAAPAVMASAARHEGMKRGCGSGNDAR